MNSLSPNYYFYILDRLVSLGLDQQKAAHIAPLDIGEQTGPSVRIGIDCLNDLLKLAGDELSIPHIGLRVSNSFRISNYGYAGSIFSTCDTLADAIVCAEKYACLAHTLGRFHKDPGNSPNEKWVKYIWEPSFDRGQEKTYRQITECVLSNYALTIKWLSWSFDGNVDKVQFRHYPKHPMSEYKNILGCDVEFEAKHNAFLIDRAFLNAKIPTANPLKLSLLKQKLNRLLAEYNQESDLESQINYALKKIIQTERPSLARVADEMSISERALKRHLKKAKIQFRDILQNVKIELCEIYMNQGISFSEIAQLLWYSDQSAFTRAYKNWHGFSPSNNKK